MDIDVARASSFLAAQARLLRVARHSPGVRGHAWLEAGALEWRGYATVAAVKTLPARQKTP
jgi:hypothetical protein